MLLDEKIFKILRGNNFLINIFQDSAIVFLLLQFKYYIKSYRHYSIYTPIQMRDPKTIWKENVSFHFHLSPPVILKLKKTTLYSKFNHCSKLDLWGTKSLKSAWFWRTEHLCLYRKYQGLKEAEWLFPLLILNTVLVSWTISLNTKYLAAEQWVSFKCCQLLNWTCC